MPAANITLSELFMLIAYMSFPVWCVARAIQWMQLKKFTATPRLVFILVLSLIISFIITIVIWGGWTSNPMFLNIICIPAVVAEGFILLMTFLLKKSLLKKWAASS